MAWSLGYRLRQGRLGRLHRGVIVHDLPPSRHSLHDQGKQAVERFPVRHGELPLTPDYGGSPAQHIDVQFLEHELAHLLAIAFVALAVALQGGFPTLGDGGARKESQIG